MIDEELHVFNVAPWCPIQIPTPKQRPVEVHNDQPSMGEWSSTDGKLLVPSIPQRICVRKDGTERSLKDRIGLDDSTGNRLLTRSGSQN